MNGRPRFPVVMACYTPHYIGQCLDHLWQQEDAHAEVFVVLNRRGLEVPPHERLHVFTPAQHLGVSGAWNVLLAHVFHLGFPAALLINDDIFLTDPRTLARCVVEAVAAPETLRYARDRGFSCVCITRTLWTHVGTFDEGFWPAYFEDNDWHRRATLLGVRTTMMDVETAHVGSGTLRADPQLETWNAHVAFPANMRRYVAKWGGLPGEETYTDPWGGNPPLPATRVLLGLDDKEDFR